jgi:hypothetical protein
VHPVTREPVYWKLSQPFVKKDVPAWITSPNVNNDQIIEVQVSADIDNHTTRSASSVATDAQELMDRQSDTSDADDDAGDEVYGSDPPTANGSVSSLDSWEEQDSEGQHTRQHQWNR